MSQLNRIGHLLITRRGVLLIGAILLLILSSIELYSLTGLNADAASRVTATMTVQNKLISTAYVKKANANEQSTALAQSHITATAQTIATATATVDEATAIARASGNPYPPHTGTLVQDDSLHNNSPSNWDSGGLCNFVGTAYHVKSTPDPGYLGCSAHAVDYSDFVFQVQMTFVKGDGGGISFRADSATGNSYTFIIDANGTYGLFKFNGYGKSVSPLKSGLSSAIKAGLNQTNTIAIIVRGKNIELYVNSTRIDSASDAGYTHGSIEVGADKRTNDTEVTYTDLKIWTL